MLLNSDSSCSDCKSYVVKVGEQIPNQWVDKGSEDGSPILRGSVQLDPAAAANVFNAGDTTQRYLFECKKSDGTAGKFIKAGNSHECS